MKKIMLLLLLLVAKFSLVAQGPFKGIWEGKFTTDMELRMIFTFGLDSTGKLTADLGLPDQGNIKFVASVLLINADSVVLKFKEMNATYTGRLINDSIIKGEWKQGTGIALQLRKIEKVMSKVRPQTPVPPFPYRSEDVTYTNPAKTIQYGATITIPKGKGPFPAVTLITGSGQQNRDEDIMGHKPFAVIADHLTKNGFIVLRVDDRGVGQTTGEVLTSTSLDFAEDVSVSLDYLKARKEVDVRRLVLLGHSEGGMIAQILAARRPDIAAIVLLAAPGVNGTELMVAQNRAIFEQFRFETKYVDTYVELYKSMLGELAKTSDITTARTAIGLRLDEWIKATPKNIVIAMTGILSEQKKAEFIDRFSETVNLPWFKYFLAFEPKTHLEKIKSKLLALNGSKDIQVIAKPNLAAIESAVKNSRSPAYKVREYEGLNHLFQKCRSCMVAEYGQLDETISVEVLNDIVAWLKAEM